MKKKFLSTDDEPALRRDLSDPLAPDPSEERVARRESLRGLSAPAEEIDRIRDATDSEPALAHLHDPGKNHFAEWLDEKKQSVSLSSALALTILAGLIAGPLAILGAIFKSDATGWVAGLYVFAFGPVVEEFFKQSGMIYFLERKPWRILVSWQFPLAAAVTAGVFATIENLLYIHVYSSDMSDEARLALAQFRWPVCTALHVGCALIASLGLRRCWREHIAAGKPAELSHAFPLFTVAIVIHGLYNLIAVLFLDDLFVDPPSHSRAGSLTPRPSPPPSATPPASSATRPWR